MEDGGRIPEQDGEERASKFLACRLWFISRGVRGRALEGVRQQAEASSSGEILAILTGYFQVWYPVKKHRARGSGGSNMFGGVVDRQ